MFQFNMVTSSDISYVMMLKNHLREAGAQIKCMCRSLYLAYEYDNSNIEQQRLLSWNQVGMLLGHLSTCSLIVYFQCIVSSSSSFNPHTDCCSPYYKMICQNELFLKSKNQNSLFICQKRLEYEGQYGITFKLIKQTISDINCSMSQT